MIEDKTERKRSWTDQLDENKCSRKAGRREKRMGESVVDAGCRWVVDERGQDATRVKVR